VVALAATERAVVHHVSSRTIGIGTGRFGNCGTHPEPPTDFTQPHILQKSLPDRAQTGFIFGRGGGTRTHNPDKEPDFKSGASTDSATPPGPPSIAAGPGPTVLLFRGLRGAAAFRVRALEAL
jgi:hypothetical protein